MNNYRKNKRPFVKQWKNQKKALKNKDHQKMHKPSRRKKRKNNKNTMLKKLRK